MGPRLAPPLAAERRPQARARAAAVQPAVRRPARGALGAPRLSFFGLRRPGGAPRLQQFTEQLIARGAAHGGELRGQFVGQLAVRSEEHTSELQSRENLVCRLLLEKKKPNTETAKNTHTELGSVH